MSAAQIVGAGAITAVGSCVDDMWRSVRQGSTGLTVLDSHDGFAAVIDRSDAKDRLYKLARSALDECVTDAGWSTPMDDRTALIFATGSPENIQIATAAEKFKASGRVRPDTVYKNMYSYVAARIASDFKVGGPVLAVSAACAGSSQAIHLAHSLLTSNTVDRVLCGGGEILDSFTLSAFLAMQAVVTTRTDLGVEAVQPFGAERSGIALGEGCGWLALTRVGETSGEGNNVAITDSGLINVPEATYGDIVNLSDWSRLIGNAAQQGDCDLVMAHATSTPVGDLAEGKAILHHFPDSQVRSSKYLLGHTLSASTVLDVIVIREAMKCGEVPSIGHAYALDPELSAMHVTSDTQKMPVRRAIKLSAAFGGAMGMLVLETI